MRKVPRSRKTLEIEPGIEPADFDKVRDKSRYWRGS
jgi:hypothetical protein